MSKKSLKKKVISGALSVQTCILSPPSGTTQHCTTFSCNYSQRFDVERPRRLYRFDKLCSAQALCKATSKCLNARRQCRGKCCTRKKITFKGPQFSGFLFNPLLAAWWRYSFIEGSGPHMASEC